MWMAMARQMRAGLLQSWHLPSAAQGVLAPSRLAFSGAATLLRALDRACQIGAQLVDAAHKDALLGAEQRRGDAVARAVDVDDLAGLAERVGRGEVDIRFWKYSPLRTASASALRVPYRNASGKPSACSVIDPPERDRLARADVRQIGARLGGGREVGKGKAAAW